jgi:hypothetical protein
VVLGAAGEREREAERMRGLGRGGDAFRGVLERVQLAARVPVLDRAADGARFRDTCDRSCGVLRLPPVTVLEIDGDGKRRRAVERPRVLGDLVERRAPSGRPSVNANPELVVASALNPSAASTRAEPASHGFGIRNAVPSWSARNAAPFSCCVGCTSEA